MGRIQPFVSDRSAGSSPLRSAASSSARDEKTIQYMNVFRIFLRVTESAPPMSRRPVTNRRELLLPLLMPDRHQTGVISTPAHLPVRSRHQWQRLRNHRELGLARSAMPGRRNRQAQRAEVASPALMAGNRLLAQLVFQRDPSTQLTQEGMTGGQGCSLTNPSVRAHQSRLPTSHRHSCTAVRRPSRRPVPPATRDSVHPTGATSAPEVRTMEETR